MRLASFRFLTTIQ